MCGGGRGGADQGADGSAHHGCGLHLHRGPALRVVLAAKPHPSAEPRRFYYYSPAPALNSLRLLNLTLSRDGLSMSLYIRNA